LESREDDGEDSESSEKEPTNWGLIFSMLKNRGFAHEEILDLSYPEFNAYMNAINDPMSFGIVIPYIGGSKDKKEGEKFESKEELLGLVASMNQAFSM